MGNWGQLGFEQKWLLFPDSAFFSIFSGMAELENHYTAIRKFKGLSKTRVEVLLPDNTTVIMLLGKLGKFDGAIQGRLNLTICDDSLYDGVQPIASVFRSSSFFSVDTVKIVDLRSNQTYFLRIKRWSFTRQLLKEQLVVAEHKTNYWKREHHTIAEPSVPEDILLLSIWLDFVKGIFLA